MSSTATKQIHKALPAEIEELVNESIDGMSESELREFETESKKIMKASKRRLDAQTASRKRA